MSNPIDTIYEICEAIKASETPDGTFNASTGELFDARDACRVRLHDIVNSLDPPRTGFGMLPNRPTRYATTQEVADALRYALALDRVNAAAIKILAALVIQLQTKVRELELRR